MHKTLKRHLIKLSGGERSRAGQLGQRKFSVGETSIKEPTALAGVAQWIDCQPARKRVTSSIPSQGTRLGCGPGPQSRRHER